MLGYIVYSIEKFLSKITVLNNGCWEWEKPNHDKGYVVICADSKRVYAHRFIYEYYHNKIKPELQIDHLCRNRICVNPNHLELVTHKENILRGFNFSAINSRKTHCPKGHYYHPNNIYYNKLGRRRCKICTLVSNRKSREKTY